MKVLRKNIMCFGLAVVLVIGFLPAVSSAAVAVFMECAYTDSDLVCYIYADTDGDSLISSGVTINYDTAELTSPVCTKNENDWYFGDPVGTKYAYMDPEVDTTNGALVFIVGKLNVNSPTEGVTDPRALIGTVTFTRLSSTNPGADPVSFFGLGCAEGRVDPYANFVNVAGTELDPGIAYSMTVAQRGDANADGNINVADYIVVRNNINATNFPPYVDCNNDGAVNVADYICVRNNFTP